MRVGIFSGAAAGGAAGRAARARSARPPRWPAPPSPPRSPPPSRTSCRPWGSKRFTVAALDLGIKAMTPALMAQRGIEVHVLPATATFEQIARRSAPDGVFFSNGPGDPASAEHEVTVLRQVLDARIPFFGICFGNQLLGRALGFGTYKLKYGHRGINQPVHGPHAPARSRSPRTTTASPSTPRSTRGDGAQRRALGTAYGRVRVSHVCLNDDVVEGLECLDLPAFSVQYHPEAAAGPHDAAYLFDRFVDADGPPRTDTHRRHRPGRARLMPKRDDITSVLVIGSGPIVIGQACEFDYSGTQACRVLREEGIRVILVNSNPATIMTDPEFADATYVEPITPEVVEAIIAKERPDAVLATLGGQTALNSAIALHENGVLEKYDCPLIGANVEAIQLGEDREKFKGVVERCGAESARSPSSPHDGRGASPPPTSSATRVVVRPVVHHGRPRAPGFAYDEADLRRIGRRRACTYSPDHRGAPRGVDPRLEGVRARGHARPRRQRRGRLLDREPRPDGRAHRRLDHRRAGADPHRPRVPAAARHRHRRSSARSASTPAAATSSSRSTRATAGSSSSR